MCTVSVWDDKTWNSNSEINVHSNAHVLKGTDLHSYGWLMMNFMCYCIIIIRTTMEEKANVLLTNHKLQLFN